MATYFKRCSGVCHRFVYVDIPYMYTVITVFVCIGSMVAFWPFFAGYHNTTLETSALRSNLSSIENIVASTVVMTLAVPLAIDGIFDFILSSLVMDKNKAKETTDILNYIERTFIYSGLFVFPLCAFISQGYSDRAQLALCCSRFQYSLVYGGCLLSVSRIAPNCFPGILCLLSLGCYYLAVNLLSHLYIHGDSVSNYGTIDTYCFYIRYAANVIVAWMLFHWMWLHYLNPYLLKRLRTSSSIRVIKSLSSMGNIETTIASQEENNETQQQPPQDRQQLLRSSLKDDITTKNVMFVSLVMTMGVICTILLLSIPTWSFMDYTPTNLAFIHIAMSVFAFGLLIYHLRKFRSDALLRLHALVNKKAVMLKYVHELYAPIITIYESNKHMIEELGSEADDSMLQTMSNTMDAVSTAAGKLRDLATHQFQDDGLPPAPTDLISTIQRYSLAMSANRRVGRVAGLSSVHCSIDSWSDNVTRGSKGDGDGEGDEVRDGDEKSGEERLSDGHILGYRGGPSWGTAATPALTPVLETIAERNNHDEDVEMGLSGVSESDRSQELQAFFRQQEQLQEQLQQQQLQRQQQQEYREQQQLQRAIQEELGRAEDRTTLVSDVTAGTHHSMMSEVTAGTLRSERHQARSFLNLRLCDTV